MKRLLVLFVLMFVTLTASAQYRHWGHRYHGPYYGGGNWVAPVIIGGVIGYGISKANSNTVIVQQPNVIVEQHSATMECGPWIEIQTPDGKIYKERTCYQK